MIGWLYALLLIAVCIFVLWQGDGELRVALLVVVATSLVTLANYRLGTGNFADFQPWLAVSESIALAVALAIALRSRRYWPLLFAAAQVLTLFAVLAPLVDKDTLSKVFGVTQGLWAYVQLAVLVSATIRGRRPGHRSLDPFSTNRPSPPADRQDRRGAK